MRVEEEADADIDRAHADLVARGLPVVRGEVVEGDVAGYHYYRTQQVLRWIEARASEIVDERYQQEDGWGYRHFLLHSPSAPFEPIRG